jgi:hypothetical protein
LGFWSLLLFFFLSVQYFAVAFVARHAEIFVGQVMEEEVELENGQKEEVVLVVEEVVVVVVEMVMVEDIMMVEVEEEDMVMVEVEEEVMEEEVVMVEEEVDEDQEVEEVMVDEDQEVEEVMRFRNENDKEGSEPSEGDCRRGCSFIHILHRVFSLDLYLFAIRMAVAKTPYVLAMFFTSDNVIEMAFLKLYSI